MLLAMMRRKKNDLKQPLLEKEDEAPPENTDTYANAGIWSKATFQWLNPLFRRGRIQKLELPHIPYVPPSERAKNASSVLDESLRKQKMEDSSLSKAIMRAIGKSLAINAVFAGVNTASSYVGPFLITNFVNYLLEKHDNSSIHHGLILAFTFFIAKTLESLSQRQWYFGAQVIGVRVRAALTLLIYQKSISIKYSCPSNGVFGLGYPIQESWCGPLCCCSSFHNFDHGMQHTFGQNAKTASLQDHGREGFKNQVNIRDSEEHQSFKVALMGAYILEEAAATQGN